jgi:hypothetical protein
MVELLEDPEPLPELAAGEDAELLGLLEELLSDTFPLDSETASEEGELATEVLE